MTVKTSPRKTFRSMAEFRQRFFPKTYAEAEEQMNPAQFGPRLAQRAMEGFRQHLTTDARKCTST